MALTEDAHMVHVRILLGIIAIALVAGGTTLGQDKKDSKDPPVKYKGQLPQNWSKLGLTDTQKQAVYKTQNDYNAKIDPLRAQIRKLQEEEKAELFKVLTDAQRSRLKEILAGKAGADVPKKDK
jgi:hypothetical protein